MNSYLLNIFNFKNACIKIWRLNIFLNNVVLFIFPQNKAASVKCHFYLSLNDGTNKIYFKIRFYFYRALSRLLLSTFTKSNDDFSVLLKFIKKCI